jgi:hypothetical protein
MRIYTPVKKDQAGKLPDIGHNFRLIFSVYFQHCRESRYYQADTVIHRVPGYRHVDIPDKGNY